MDKVLVYGATGYMGRLCVRELERRGFNPIVAGRSSSVQAVADAFGLEARVIPLDGAMALQRALGGVSLVVNAAGPFSSTQRPLIEACIAARVHYADLAGETDEMLRARSYDEAARAAGVTLLPGAGFGVVPTDLAASEAARRCSHANQLTIMYATEGGASRGTLKTVLGDIARTGVRRVSGELVPAQPAETKRTFSVSGQTFEAVYNPWRADLVTAAISTGIETVETYSVFPAPIVYMMKGRLLWLRNLLLGPLFRLLPEGPSERQLERGRTYIEVVASSEQGACSVKLTGPEAYLFTARCVVAIAARMQRADVPAGFQTPSVFGRELLDEVEGVSWEA